MQRCPSLFGNTKSFERKHQRPYVEEWRNWSYNYHNDSTKSTWDKRCKSWKLILTDTQKYVTTYIVWHHTMSRLKTEKLLCIKWCVWTYIQILLWEYIHSKSIKSLSKRTTLNFKKIVTRRKREKRENLKDLKEGYQLPI